MTGKELSEYDNTYNDRLALTSQPTNENSKRKNDGFP